MLTQLAVLCASVSHGPGWPAVSMATTSDLLTLTSNRIQVSEDQLLRDCVSSCSH